MFLEKAFATTDEKGAVWHGKHYKIVIINKNLKSCEKEKIRKEYTERLKCPK